MHDELFIQSSEINAFVYCPKQWYYRFVLNINIKNDAMKIGTFKHEKHWMQVKKRKECMFISPELKIKGKIDYVIEENGNQIPIEIKSGRYHDDKEYDKMQLITYIKLLRSSNPLFKYNYGYLLYIKSRKKIRMDITKKDYEAWNSYVASIRSYRRSKLIPKSTDNKNRCNNCSLKEMCLI